MTTHPTKTVEATARDAIEDVMANISVNVQELYEEIDTLNNDIASRKLRKQVVKAAIEYKSMCLNNALEVL